MTRGLVSRDREAHHAATEVEPSDVHSGLLGLPKRREYLGIVGRYE